MTSNGCTDYARIRNVAVSFWVFRLRFMDA